MVTDSTKLANARLLLLSKFLRGNLARYARDRDHTWRPVLGEAAEKTIEKFVRDGYLEIAGISASMELKFNLADLKRMLKTRGLKISGNKAQLINRLLEADEDAMMQEVADLELLRCTAKGIAIVENYIAAEAEKRKRAEEDSFNALRRSSFAEASQIVGRYEAEQVFARGLGVDWEGAQNPRVVRQLEIIANANPCILKGIKPECLSHIRVAAQMMQLWGSNATIRWIPVLLETGHKFDANTAAQMFTSFAVNMLRLQEYRDPELRVFLKGIRVSGIEDERQCPGCAALEGRLFSPDDVPELPYEHCTSERGCRCLLVAKVVGDTSN